MTKFIITITLVFSYILNVNAQGTASIDVKIEGTVAGDSMTLRLYPTSIELLNMEAAPFKEYKAYLSHKGTFNFQIPVKTFSYFSLGKGYSESLGGPLLNLMMYKYLIKNGDLVRVSLNKAPLNSFINKEDIYFQSFNHYGGYSFSFSGNGSAKYACRYKADSINARQQTSASLYFAKRKLYWGNNAAIFDLGLMRSFEVLNNYKNEIDLQSYSILKADFIAKYEGDKLDALKGGYASSVQVNDKTSQEKFRRGMIAAFNKGVQFDLSTQQYSKAYAGFLLQKELVKLSLQNLPEKEIYDNLKSKFRRTLRERILTTYILHKYAVLSSPTNDQQLYDAIASITASDFHQMLVDFKKRYSKGVAVYKFELPDVNGTLVKLEDFKGKVVFIDFYYSGCGACTDYFKQTLSKVEEHYKQNPEIVFVSVSIDKDKQKWLAAVEKEIYTSKSVVNLYTDGLGARHPIIKNYNIESYPQPMLIDRKGNIFNTSKSDLRFGGVEGLTETIEAALQQ